LLVVTDARTIALFLIDDTRLTWLIGLTDTWAFSGVFGGFDFGDASNKNVGGSGRGLVGVVGGALRSFKSLWMRLCLNGPLRSLGISSREGRDVAVSRRDERIE